MRCNEVKRYDTKWNEIGIFNIYEMKKLDDAKKLRQFFWSHRITSHHKIESHTSFHPYKIIFKHLHIDNSTSFYQMKMHHIHRCFESRLLMYRRSIESEPIPYTRQSTHTICTLQLVCVVGSDLMDLQRRGALKSNCIYHWIKNIKRLFNRGYTISKMFKLAFDRIFSYSMFPIRLATYSGFTIALISFLVGLALIIRRIFGIVASGWTSTVVLILFLFGITFVFLGIIGEYLGRIFLEAKNRPRYHCRKKIESSL